MSIPTPFNPLGALGGGIEPLEYVTVDGTAAAANEDLVTAALGERYIVGPHGSSGYFAEVKVTDVRGTYRGPSAAGPASIGSYSTVWGQMFAYTHAYSDMPVACWGRRQIKFVRSDQDPADGAWYWMRFKDGGVEYDSDKRSGSYIGEWCSWTKAEMEESTYINKGMYIVRMAGLSYKFHGMKVVTESQSFDAVPARMGGKEGIAFYIDGKFKAFLEL